MGNLDMAIKKCKKSYQTHQNIPHTTNAKMFNKNDGTVSFFYRMMENIMIGNSLQID